MRRNGGQGADRDGIVLGRNREEWRVQNAEGRMQSFRFMRGMEDEDTEEKEWENFLAAEERNREVRRLRVGRNCGWEHGPGGKVRREGCKLRNRRSEVLFRSEIWKSWGLWQRTQEIKTMTQAAG